MPRAPGRAGGPAAAAGQGALDGGAGRPAPGRPRGGRVRPEVVGGAAARLRLPPAAAPPVPRGRVSAAAAPAGRSSRAERSRGCKVPATARVKV